MAEMPLWLEVIQAGSYVVGAGSAGVAAAKYRLDLGAARKASTEAAQRKIEELAAREKAGAEAALRKVEENAAREEANRIAERDLQWRRMSAAQALLEQMEEDEMAAIAMTMLDWHARTYKIKGQEFVITDNRLYAALRTGGDAFSDPEIFVRDAFDHLFWFFERIQHQIDLNMIELAHVRFPLGYLAGLMNKNIKVFEGFFDSYGYPRTKQLVCALLQLER